MIESLAWLRELITRNTPVSTYKGGASTTPPLVFVLPAPPERLKQGFLPPLGVFTPGITLYYNSGWTALVCLTCLTGHSLFWRVANKTFRPQ